METTKIDNNKSSLIYKTAGFTALALIIFFLLMKFLSLITIVELRFFNFLIIYLGVRYVLMETKKNNNGKLEYLQGMGTGFLTAVLTALFFGIFVLLYLQFIDAKLMQFIIETQPFGTYLNPASASLVVVMEGAASGAIIVFALMHLLNKDKDQG